MSVATDTLVWPAVKASPPIKGQEIAQPSRGFVSGWLGQALMVLLGFTMLGAGLNQLETQSQNLLTLLRGVTQLPPPETDQLGSPLTSLQADLLLSNLTCQQYFAAYSQGLFRHGWNPTNQPRCNAWCASWASDEASQSQCAITCTKHPQVADFSQYLQLSEVAAKKAARAAYGDLAFVVFYVVGDRGAEGYDHHQLPAPSMNFAAALQKSHPHAHIILLTDLKTQLAVPPGVEIFRVAGIDSKKLGRNAYANFYQFKAQVAFLEAMLKAGKGDMNVAFIDMDMLIVDSLAEVFCGEFDYGLTISDAADMPINIGTQFVRGGHFRKAISFLGDVLSIYNFNETFVAGQIAISDTVNMREQPQTVMEALQNAVRYNQHCKHVLGKYDVCFFPCMKYNYCHLQQSCCTDPTDARRLPFSMDSGADLAASGVKVLHFVGHRKAALDLVHNQFMQSGKQGALDAFAALPAGEENFNERLAAVAATL
jgi:hypothetical protein